MPIHGNDLFHEAEGLRLPRRSLPLRWDPALTIAAKAKIKVDKYAPVMQILKFFERDGRIAETHSFVPFIVSSLGELSKEAFCLIEEIVAMYRHRISRCEEVTFPLLPNQAVADFRYRFKLAVMRVAAVGLANIACSACLPIALFMLYINFVTVSCIWAFIAF